MNPYQRLARITDLSRQVQALGWQLGEDAEDPVEWVQKHTGMVPDPWQAKFLRDETRAIGMCCGRQVGKTHATAWKGAHHAATTMGGKVVMTAKTERQSKFLMRHAKRALHKAGVKFFRETTFELELANGAEVYALPGSEDTVRGLDAVTLLIIDEAAFCTDALYEAVEPMVAITKGQQVLLSSADATFGFFYRIMTSDDPNWSRYHITAYDCPRYDKEWLEWKRRTISPRVFAREYLAEFVDPQGVWIPEEMRKRARAELVDPLDAEEPDHLARLHTEMEDLDV